MTNDIMTAFEGTVKERRVNNERVKSIGLKALRCIACGRATAGSAAVGRRHSHSRMTRRPKEDDIRIAAAVCTATITPCKCDIITTLLETCRTYSAPKGKDAGVR